MERQSAPAAHSIRPLGGELEPAAVNPVGGSGPQPAPAPAAPSGGAQASVRRPSLLCSYNPPRL